MPMTQTDIRAHYEQEWKNASERARSATDLTYSSPVEDAVLYPTYVQFLRDQARAPDARAVLDVGSGSGRWIRFFTDHFAPASVTGMDYTRAAVDLLERWWGASSPKGTPLAFRHASITDPALNLEKTFDLINISNVLFHIPEDDLFMAALRNLRKHLAAGGAIVTTEYMPRATMRTNWMKVRSRYEFADAAAQAGLRISAVRAFSFFSNDPMGIDGPDSAGRDHFHTVRARTKQVLAMSTDATSRAFFVELFADIERAALAFGRERVAEIDMPSQKLVLLTPTD
jgi:SAM-dependent methyltransferase